MKKLIWKPIEAILDWADPYWAWSNLWKLIVVLVIVYFGHNLMH